ncbi:MAG: RIP metalloprotease RseP [Eubacteriales Family XIII. Incertae Sedis bacterium]|nr:MAG: RIP metalloprotease RseP [Clostridiales Family XIII bacterium]
MTLIYALLIFCLLIFFHELGHFTLAKLCGVKVNEFALGMGPAVLKKQKGETLYSLRAFPIGGFCAMEGEDEDSEDERAFNKKAAWQKALIVVAGAAMNLLVAIVIMSAISFYVGTSTTTIDTVQDGLPAQAAGIESGDTIIAINGITVSEWRDVYTFISESDGETIRITLTDADGSERTVATETVADADGRRIIGITPTTERHLISSVKTGVQNTWALGASMLDVLKGLFTGGVSASELSGPVGIVAVVNDTASRGFIYIAYLTALISLNLAIMNMLPFPALDGGRFVFIIIRAVTGKAITDEIEGKVHFAGILVLLALMLYVTWNDIVKFILPIFS